MTDLTTRSNGIHPAVQDHFQGMNDALHERDELRKELQQRDNQLAVATQLNSEYKEQIAILTQDRDYYYRKAMAFTHTLSTARNMIENVFSLVDHEAENSNKAPDLVEVAKELEIKE